jgi:hypothetical protein
VIPSFELVEEAYEYSDDWILEKNNINKKRVDTIKKLLMKESKLRKDK